MEEPTDDRPSMLTEVRAWLVVAFAFVVQLIAVVYWAATLSSDIKTLQYQVTEFKVNSINDHEIRIRNLEAKARQ
jgi:hypothetical protein